jgi:hypothetical protein
MDSDRPNTTENVSKIDKETVNPKNDMSSGNPQGHLVNFTNSVAQQASMASQKCKTHRGQS